MRSEDIETANVANSLKMLKSKRKETNGAVARWGSGVKKVHFLLRGEIRVFLRRVGKMDNVGE